MGQSRRSGRIKDGAQPEDPPVTLPGVCGRSHRYTVQDETRQRVLYAGGGRDEAVSALVTLRPAGQCGHITAEHASAGTARRCPEESGLLEDEAIKVWDAAHMAGRAAGSAHPQDWPSRPDRYLDAQYLAYCEGFAETAHRSEQLDDLLAALHEARDMGWLDEPG